MLFDDEAVNSLDEATLGSIRVNSLDEATLSRLSSTLATRRKKEEEREEDEGVGKR